MSIQTIFQRKALLGFVLLLAASIVNGLPEQGISEHSIAPSASESPVNWDLRHRLAPVLSIKDARYRDRQASDVLATPSKQYG